MFDVAAGRCVAGVEDTQTLGDLTLHQQPHQAVCRLITPVELDEAVAILIAGTRPQQAVTLGNEAIEEALQELNDRERAVVRLRFGLDDGQIRTLEEVGKEFGVTRERIRQIESKTLAKLRHPTRSQRLRDYLEES